MQVVRHVPALSRDVAATATHPRLTVIAASLWIALAGAGFAGTAGGQIEPVRDVEVRSFLGEPLNARIGVSASMERDSATCQSVLDRGQRNGLLQAADLQLTMVELRSARYLEVRSRAPINEPVVRFALRIGCPGDQPVDREFTLLLDPPPFSAAATSQTGAGSGGVNDDAGDAPVSGNWTVVAGDTLQSIARGIYPRDRARQRQYMLAMRELNPQLGNLRDAEKLTAGTTLRTPDLKMLSGMPPPAAAATSAPLVAPAPARTEPRKSAPRAPSVRSAPTVAAVPVPVPPVSAPARPAPAAPPPSPAEAAAAKPPVPKAAPAAGFRLRLSGAEIDVSRSRNITEEQRRELREKQLLMDSDDQVAALLALRNTVKQLESRLNALQLSMSVATAAPVAATATAKPMAPETIAPPQPPPAAPVATAPVEAAAPTPPAATVVTAPGDAGTTPPAQAAKPTATEPRAEPSAFDTLLAALSSPMILAVIVAAVLTLVGAWWWASRRRRAGRNLNERSAAENDGNPLLAKASVTAAASVPPAAAIDADWDDEPAPGSAVDNGPDTGPPIIDSHAAFDNVDADEPMPVMPVFSPPAAHQSTVKLDTPLIFDETPDRYVLDSTPATTVDFPLGLDDKPPEDRVRRLQYMHERYPELKTNTISIDDADSVINAARLYYDEGEGGGGRDKACELLTFAVEERPQEIRFWLAQFEIFRLENMTAAFGELASKFHVLFGHSTSWPKVRHIGHEIDPGNPLYAEAGRPSLSGETRFDPIAENWLNAPMDFTSDALMSDLRLALLDDQNVTRDDLDGAAAKLTAGAGTK